METPQTGALTGALQGRLYGMTMSDDYAILFVGANGCSPVSGFQCRLDRMSMLGGSKNPT
ncbi:hypothetical protein PHOSAC3_120115 [Mesotoga infera]|nr:hypothetical protein PHOSAC3_120115 [Mesotoga infera]